MDWEASEEVKSSAPQPFSQKDPSRAFFCGVFSFSCLFLPKQANFIKRVGEPGIASNDTEGFRNDFLRLGPTGIPSLAFPTKWQGGQLSDNTRHETGSAKPSVSSPPSGNREKPGTVPVRQRGLPCPICGQSPFPKKENMVRGARLTPRSLAVLSTKLFYVQTRDRPLATAMSPLSPTRPDCQIASQAGSCHPSCRVQIGGTLCIIRPKHGLLSFKPDTPEWFAWVVEQDSFRFVGKGGYFTACHEWRVPKGAWRAHRHIRNHNETLRLAPNPELTIAVLEDAALKMQAFLA